MAPLKKLLDLTVEEQRKFLASFDTVFCDLDGVLWEIGKPPFAGVPEAINAMRKLGKRIVFVSNNSTLHLDVFMTKLACVNATKDEVVRPVRAIVWYLRKIKFDKEIYTISFEGCRNTLKEAGFKVVTDEVVPVSESPIGIVQAITHKRPNVGAVFIDFSVNVTFLQLQRCIQYVTDNDALFLVGGIDSKIPVQGVPLIGAIHFARIVEEFTGKTALKLSKPFRDFHDLMEEKLGPFDAKRILFLGDSIESDMKFATECGYQKLLPLSGNTTEEDLKHWKHEEKMKPDYVVDSVADINTVIQNLGLGERAL